MNTEPDSFNMNLGDDVDLLQELEHNPELMQIALTPPIAFNPVLVDVSGSITCALFLSMCMQESTHTEWVDLDIQKIHSNTKMSHGEIRGARKKLRQCGLLDERRMGMPVRVEYRVNYDLIKHRLIALARQACLASGNNSTLPSLP